MEFEFNEDQRLVRDSVRRFLDAEIQPLDDEYGDREMTPELARELLKMLIPFGYIGPERPDDPIITGILYEEMGRVSPSLGGLVYIASVVGPLVRATAHPEVRDRLAQPLMNGELIGCVAISEPNVGSDPTGIECHAELKGDRWVINGTKTWISNGHIADVACITVQTDRTRGPAGLRQLLVDRRETPFQSRDIETIGVRAFPTSELVFDDLEVPAINRLGGWTERSPELAMGGREVGISPFDFQGARVMCASLACGIARKALDVAVGYVQERKQFGREIGRFQMVQGLLADMAIDLEAARLLTYQARQLMSRRRADYEVSIAKAFATEMGVRVTSKAMECLGAMGLARETGLERCLRDARMWMVPDGTAQIQRLVIGRELTGFSATRG
jgi:alkylation response protein AidB-like acyl-CoA dehydrogenase